MALVVGQNYISFDLESGISTNADVCYRSQKPASAGQKPGKTLRSPSRAINDADWEERNTFVESQMLFQSWHPQMRRVMECGLRKEVFPPGRAIVSQGDRVYALHFLVMGQAHVIVKRRLHKQQYPTLYSDAETANSRGRDKKTDVSERSIHKTQIRVRRKQGYAAAERRLVEQSVPITCLNVNDIIGDMELLIGMDTYSGTVIATVHTETYVLEYKNMDKFALKKQVQTMKELTRMVEDKLSSRKELTPGGLPVELYKLMYDKLLSLKLTRLNFQQVKEEESAPEVVRLVRAAVKENAEKREQCMAQLVKLFLKNKVPLITPTVPGALYYRAKSYQRAEHIKRIGGRHDRTTVSINLRLSRARMNTGRQPLSLRQLQRFYVRNRFDYDKLHKGTELSKTLTRTPTSLLVVSRRLSDDKEPVGGIKNNLSLTANEPVLENTTLKASTMPPTNVQSHQKLADASTTDIKRETLQNILSTMDTLQEERRLLRNKFTTGLKERYMAYAPASNILRPEQEIINQKAFVATFNDPDNHYDWHTSDSVLNILEEKIKLFFEKYEKSRGDSKIELELSDKGMLKRPATSVVQMKRFIVADPEEVPVVGGMVCVHRKHCVKSASLPSSAHRHIQHYMIPRAAPVQSEPKELTTSQLARL